MHDIITQILFPVKSSSSISTAVIRFPVLGSRPFVALIAIFSHEIADDNWEEFSLIDAAGTANIIRSELSIASLGDARNLLNNVKKIVEERHRLFNLLTSIPALKPWPSHGNYILCQAESGDVNEIYKGLAKRGVFVRMFSSERLSDCFRVAIGKPAESDFFMEALKELI